MAASCPYVFTQGLEDLLCPTHSVSLESPLRVVSALASCAGSAGGVGAAGGQRRGWQSSLLSSAAAGGWRCQQGAVVRACLRLRVGAPCASLHILKRMPGRSSNTQLVLLVRLACALAKMRAVFVEHMKIFESGSGKVRAFAPEQLECWAYSCVDLYVRH